MKKIVTIYGFIAGLIVICSIMIGIVTSDGEGVETSPIFGYLIMFIALSLIYFGVRKYRDQELGGVIRFGRAFTTGLCIAAIAALMYVVVWEIYLHVTDFSYINDYTASVIAKNQTLEISPEESVKLIREMDKLKADYAKPLHRIAMTFTEIFPVGALVALVSAFALRYPKGKVAG